MDSLILVLCAGGSADAQAGDWRGVRRLPGARAHGAERPQLRQALPAGQPAPAAAGRGDLRR